LDSILFRWFRSPVKSRRAAFYVCFTTTAVIALADWFINISLGLLYCIPMLLVAAHLKTGEIVEVAFIYTCLRESLGAFAWQVDVVPRVITAFVAFSVVGLFSREINRRKKNAEAHAQELAEQIARCEAYERQLLSIVEGSPAPNLIVNSAGRVMMANQSAHHLLRCPDHSLPGQLIDAYLPGLQALRETSRVHRLVRTLIECTGQRLGGEVFLAHVWVSSFGTPDAAGLNVVIFDATEQLRAREEVSLEALATGAHVIMSAFWHEIHNLCAAMRLSVNSLGRRPGVADAEELAALNSLMTGLERLTASGFRPETGLSFDVASLRAVLDHLRIVIDPWFKESGITVRWYEPPDYLLIRADHHGLLQVCLNLARNASRALEPLERKEFSVITTVEGDHVLVRFHNTGAPISEPDQLFRPFHSSAGGTGLGLYVSRAIVRSFGGDLRYEPVNDGCRFTVVLERAALPFINQEVRALAEDPRVAS